MQAQLPNALTVSRILIIPVVCGLLFVGQAWANWAALAAYVVACITDFLDGYLARTMRVQSSFGRFLDPIADKLLIATVLLVLAGLGQLPGVHLLPAAVILCREILVSGLREHLGQLQVSVPVTRLAKWKTTIQMIALGFLVVGGAGPSFGMITTANVGLAGLWASAALTLVTGYDYLRAGLRHMDTSVEAARGSAAERADPARDAG